MKDNYNIEFNRGRMSVGHLYGGKCPDTTGTPYTSSSCVYALRDQPRHYSSFYVRHRPTVFSISHNSAITG